MIFIFCSLFLLVKDILQEPISIFLNQESAQRGPKAQSIHNHKLNYDVTSKGLVDGSFDLTLFSENRLYSTEYTVLLNHFQFELF